MYSIKVSKNHSWAQFHGSAYRKRRFGACRSREFCAYGQVHFTGNFGLCTCIIYVTRQSLLTQLAEQFSACSASGEWWSLAQNLAVSRTLKLALVSPYSKENHRFDWCDSLMAFYYYIQGTTQQWGQHNNRQVCFLKVRFFSSLYKNRISCLKVCYLTFSHTETKAV